MAILPDRVKAAVIDSIIIIVLMYGATEFLTLFDTVPTSIRALFFAVIFLLYDPLLTSFFGGTIGHSKAGIMVKKDSDARTNISLPAAILRFAVKFSLGWLSLLTVTGNEKRKALHDMLVGSVVLMQDPKL